MTSTVDGDLGQQPGIAVGVAPHHLAQPHARRALADGGHRRPALEHGLVRRSGHVVEVVVDPDRVVAELLGQHRDLDGLVPLGLGPVDADELHLPALGHERPEDQSVAHVEQLTRDGYVRQGR